MDINTCSIVVKLLVLLDTELNLEFRPSNFVKILGKLQYILKMDTDIDIVVEIATPISLEHLGSKIHHTKVLATIYMEGKRCSKE